VCDAGLAEFMGLVPGAKKGKGVGVGNQPEVESVEDLVERGWALREYRQVDLDHFESAQGLERGAEEEACHVGAHELAAPSACGDGNASDFGAANRTGNTTSDPTCDAGRVWVGGDARASRNSLLSDMNWSPLERVLYKIPPDPQVNPSGFSTVHLRPHPTAEEFLGISQEDLHSSACGEVFTPIVDTTGLG
jgi:hypothetical protein